MARKQSGARLWLEPERHHKSGSITKGTWYIRDTSLDGKPIKISTGVRAGEADEKQRREAALAEYLKTNSAIEPIKESAFQSAKKTSVADVISLYIEKRLNWSQFSTDFDKPLARPADVENRLAILLEFFGEMTAYDVSVKNVDEFSRWLYQRRIVQERQKFDRMISEQYQKRRTEAGKRRLKKLIERKAAFEEALKKPADQAKAARRYLEDLQAAFNLAERYQMITHAIKVPKPKKYKVRQKVFTRSDIAKLLKTAWTKKGLAFIDGKPQRDVRIWRHLARYIIIAAYTGSRKARIWRASFTKSKDRPWIEVKKVNGIITATYHRIGEGEKEYEKKRAPTIELPTRLAAHLYRWKKMGLEYPCQWHNGQPVDPKGSLRDCIVECFGPDSGFVGHSFRHTAATFLMRDTTMPVADIAGFIGITIDTLMRVYGHHRSKNTRHVGETLVRMRDPVEYRHAT
ncbi:hypothetical protein [Rhizobium sp. C1]|uniref:hypothetical protein n=1 Tax=Rhizobium sp. C1 TaxID=1349799 RepID=UPI001E58A580|nr:hypothetical protein [Rhizobium sp. C1]MCD2177360.1 hypothetical protein [Rhizobium sp. C1]